MCERQGGHWRGEAGPRLGKRLRSSNGASKHLRSGGQEGTGTRWANGGQEVGTEGPVVQEADPGWGGVVVKLLHLAIESSQTLPVFGYPCALFLAPEDPGPSLLAGGGGDSVRRGCGVEVSQVGTPSPLPFPPPSPEGQTRQLQVGGSLPRRCQLMPARPPYPRVHGRQCSLARAPLCL